MRGRTKPEQDEEYNEAYFELFVGDFFVCKIAKTGREEERPEENGNKGKSWDADKFSFSSK